MPTFTDNEKFAWDGVINVTVLQRVRSRLGLDLMDLGTTEVGETDQLLTRLVRDPVLLCNVIYVVCQRQAEAAKISDEQFGCRMAGDAIDAATKALLQAIVDFFPSRRDRERAERVVQTMWRAVSKVQDHLDALTSPAELKRRADMILAKLPEPGGSSGSAPESSESTPDR